MDWIQENLALNLQLTLLETLIGSCLKDRRRIDELIKPILEEDRTGASGTEAEKVLDQLVQDAGEAGKFAILLYFRWVVRSLPRIHLPLPPLTKHQIYASGGLSGSNYVSANDPYIGQQVKSSAGTYHSENSTVFFITNTNAF